ncbi:hypothetical protein B0T26DRAFT_216836 [Lasiosphaeria miniovina]|uniref:Uncharacterized protein n=1 Tax=Lasiosphaeria miniovina TaxID=1954250 RepID=A0AA40AUR1_9PEZI|nr:uncharacterized protein B0T26DRAFT_216836 [Lasiosphaeria miniovina]KAK0722386.1 hypothetical protein B0T26DRAFT_216836 [Lasiosphaeria miniovina]
MMDRQRRQDLPDVADASRPVTPEAVLTHGNVDHPETTFIKDSREEQPRADSQIPLIGKRGSVKNNPFVVADQIAKTTRVSEPEPEPPSAIAETTPPSKYLHNTPLKGGQYGDKLAGPREAREQHGNAYSGENTGPQDQDQTRGQFRLAPIERTKETGLLSSILESRLASFANSNLHRYEPEWLHDRHDADEPITPQLQSSRAVDRRPSPRAEVVNDRGPSPVVQRVKVLAQQASSGALEKVLEVDVDASGRRVPRVRVSSPPAWLKYPSNKPGTLEGRLKQVTTKSSPGLSNQQQRQLAEEEYDRHFPPRPLPVVKAAAPFVAAVARASQGKADVPSGIHTSSVTHNQAQPRQVVATTATVGTSVGGSPRGTVSSTVSPGGLAASQGTEAEFTAYSTRWKRQHSDLAPHEMRRSTVGMTSTTDTSEDEGLGLDAGSQLGEDDDVGIQGLTIVLHLRGKDDLVISTDLTRDAEESTPRASK